MEQERIAEILESIGLSKNEVKIYLDLSANGSSSALDISRRTKIYRSNTYDSLRNLVDKGFVSRVVRNKKMLFRAMTPEKIKDYVYQRKQDIESIIPHLKKISGSNVEVEDIFVDHGVFALRRALNDLLDLKKPIDAFGIPQTAVRIIGEGFIRDFHKKRIKSKIPMRHIYNQDAAYRMNQLNKMKFTQGRHLSKKYDSITSTNICGDFVMLFIFTDNPIVLAIKNKQIADAYRGYFDILWSYSRA